MMRVTQRAVVLTSLQGLNSNLAAVSKLQQQLTAGKTISRPSDSPTGTNTSLVTRKAISGNDQYARNISDGQTFLDATDSAIQDMLSQVRRVRDLTVQALNGGAQSASSQQAIATEISGIRESMLGQANQVVQGRPLFGGATGGSKAYDSTGGHAGVGGAKGVAVQPPERGVGGGGAAGVAPQPRERRISDVETIRVGLTGPEAFGDPAGGKDLFSVV